jgi:hypothetical protein
VPQLFWNENFFQQPWTLFTNFSVFFAQLFFIKRVQGCQILLDTIYQNEGKYTKLPQHYQMAIKYTKWPLRIPAFSILRASKINPNWDFWFENKPSGNPDRVPKIGRFFSGPSAMINFQCLSWHFLHRHRLMAESRVARWFVFKPLSPILVKFGGPWNGKCCILYFMTT